jgi:uncharacterized damage-inducible protein DinB
MVTGLALESAISRKKESRMSEISEILNELREIHDGNAWHGPSLDEALTGVSAEQAATRPIGAAHSIWEIVYHIAGWENVWRRRLEGDGAASEPEEGDFPAVPEVSEAAWRSTRQHLNDNHRAFLDAIAVLTEAQLDTKVPQRDYTHRFMLRSAVRHHVYHTGQIALLSRAFAGRDQALIAGNEA